MSVFEWKGYTWRVGHPWGITKPEKANSWFGDKSVWVYKDVLKLKVDYNPKTFVNGYVSDGKEITKPYSVGLVTCCKDDFTYGTYTWKAKLPCGTNLWPSLWTCARDSWPPEIDMIEAYTYPNKMCYVDNWLSSLIECNVHYGTEDNHKNAKAKGIPTLVWKLFKKKDGINEYKFVWTKNYVKFYFNGVLFRTIKDKEILDSLNKSPYQYPIMNLEINDDFTATDCDYCPIFEIYDFNYQKI